MANLTKAQRLAKAAAADAAAATAAAADAASAQTTSAENTKTGDSGTADGTAVASNGKGLETTVSEATQAAADAAALDAANAALVGEVTPAAGADDGIDTAATIADQDAPSAGTTLGFPLRARVTNNTRMPVQVPALHLDLPASGEATITIYSEGDFKTLHSDLTALFSLNGFRENAFTVSPAETTEA